MQAHMRNHAYPGQTSRARAIEQELLIDVREWAEASGVNDPFSFPAAITIACWDQITTVPYRLLGKISADDRVTHVVRRAAMALERFLKSEDSLEPPTEFCLEFGATLPTASPSGGSWKILHLESSTDDGGAPVLTIGLPSECEVRRTRRTHRPTHPRARTQHDRQRRGIGLGLATEC